jgi:hypothetical protein
MPKEEDSDAESTGSAVDPDAESETEESGSSEATTTASETKMDVVASEEKKDGETVATPSKKKKKEYVTTPDGKKKIEINYFDIMSPADREKETKYLLDKESWKHWKDDPYPSPDWTNLKLCWNYHYEKKDWNMVNKMFNAAYKPGKEEVEAKLMKRINNLSDKQKQDYKGNYDHVCKEYKDSLEPHAKDLKRWLDAHPVEKARIEDHDARIKLYGVEYKKTQPKVKRAARKRAEPSQALVTITPVKPNDSESKRQRLDERLKEMEHFQQLSLHGSITNLRESLIKEFGL